MDDRDWLAQRFDEQRPQLVAVAYRMLGSLAEAEDAVQETWVRLSRADASAVDNLAGWLTTVVGRVCLNVLRSRATRREKSLDTQIAESIATNDTRTDRVGEECLLLGVGLALLVILEALDPAERLAFVLHDMFAVPFEEIAEAVGRSPAAARQLASRGRRRVRGKPRIPDNDLARQREVVDAFLAASRNGDFDALVSFLDPDVVLRADETAAARGARRTLHGSRGGRQGIAPPPRPTGATCARERRGRSRSRSPVVSSYSSYGPQSQTVGSLRWRCSLIRTRSASSKSPCLIPELGGCSATASRSVGSVARCYAA